MTKLRLILLLFAIIFLASCNEDDEIQEFTIISFTPKSALEGDKITVIGKDFPNDKRNTLVTVNGLEFAVESINNDTLVCFVPKNAQSGQIRVVYKGNDAISTETLSIEKFEIIDFIPNVGFEGDVVSISGNGFTTEKNDLNVKFNGVDAVILQSNINTILVKIPPTATTGRVTVSYNNTTITSAYDFKIVEKIDKEDPKGNAEVYLPVVTNSLLFQNWEYDEEDKRTGFPELDSTWFQGNMNHNGFPSTKVNIKNISTNEIEERFYRASGNQYYADGKLETQLPELFSDQLGNDIDWVVLLDLDRTSWQVYNIDGISFQIPLQGQTANVELSSTGNAKIIGQPRMETIAGKELEIIEVEYTFVTDITIRIGFFPLSQGSETKSRYWFAKGYGIVKEIFYNGEETGTPIGGDFSTPGERVLFKINE